MSSSPPAPSDIAEIEAIARDYVEGWYDGNVERMDRALHAELVKRIPVGEGAPGQSQLRMVTKARMLQLTAEGGGAAPDVDVEILIDDVSTDIATARVVSPEYLDYLHLVLHPLPQCLDIGDEKCRLIRGARRLANRKERRPRRLVRLPARWLVERVRLEAQHVLIKVL